MLRSLTPDPIAGMAVLSGGSGYIEVESSKDLFLVNLTHSLKLVLTNGMEVVGGGTVGEGNRATLHKELDNMLDRWLQCS